MTFVLNGIPYEIIEIDQIEYKKIREEQDKQKGIEKKENVDGIYYGASHYDICKIYLDKDLTYDRKRKTLMHELAHCYINEYITHVDYQLTQEEAADLVANSHDIIENIIHDYFGASL